jgi:hypothetical protein
MNDKARTVEKDATATEAGAPRKPVDKIKPRQPEG